MTILDLALVSLSVSTYSCVVTLSANLAFFSLKAVAAFEDCIVAAPLSWLWDDSLPVRAFVSAFVLSSEPPGIKHGS